jgi:GcrA cell cycle regulator
MSLAEREYCNQFNTPWSEAAKLRLIELWPTGKSGPQIAAILNAEFGANWRGASITRKAERLRLPRKRHAPVWNADLLAQLKSLWEKNDSSATEIAANMNNALGTEFSRSAILSKVRNLGLVGRRAAYQPVADSEKRSRDNARKRQWYAKNRGTVIERNRKYYERAKTRAVAPKVEDFAIPTPQRKTLMQLEAHDCRWPVGEPKSDLFFFCGAVAEDDRPYCPAHCRRAFIETRPAY